MRTMERYTRLFLIFTGTFFSHGDRAIGYDVHVGGERGGDEFRSKDTYSKSMV